MKLSVSLPPPLADFLRRAVASGQYPSASEAARAALRQLEQRDRAHAAQRERLRHAIRQGLESGPAIPLDLAQIKRLGRARRAAL